MIVFTNTEDGLKASGRSIESYNMFEELSKCRDLFTKFGGHPMAAGISMPKDNFNILDKKLNENTVLTDDDLREKIYIDVPMPIDFVSEQLIEQLSLIEPFGKGNEKPVFAEQHLSILSMRRIGKNNNMLKLKVSNERCVIDALMFNDADRFLLFLENEYGKKEVENAFLGHENCIDIAFTYYPGINEYYNEKNLQITVLDYCRIKK